MMAASLCVAVATERCTMTTVCTASLLALQAACTERGVELHPMFHDRPIQSMAREELPELFLKRTSCSHLLIVGHDVGFDAADVFRMLEFDRPIVSAAAPLGVHWSVYREAIRRNSPTPLATGLIYSVTLSQGEEMECVDGFLRARHTSPHFILLQRSLVERVRDEKHPTGWCDRMAELGEPVWIDSRAKVRCLWTTELKGAFSAQLVASDIPV